MQKNMCHGIHIFENFFLMKLEIELMNHKS